MSTEPLGPKALLGQLRETGVSATLTNRIEELLALFGNNIPQFCALSRAKLEKAYNDAHPASSELEKKRGLGNKTYAAFDAFVRLWKQSCYDARQVAKATVEEQERKEAERAEMREALLSKEMDADTVLKVLEAFERLGRKKFNLGEMLNLADMVKGTA